MDPAIDTIKCTYNIKVCPYKQDNPHSRIAFNPINPKIYEDTVQIIGNTPLVRLNKIPQSFGLKCEVLAKLDFFNPGGSYKDRIAQRMVYDAEKSGRIKKGDTIIEATSGNTGIGLALVCAVKGYKCIITLPEKMSNEKVDTLKALGAIVYRTPTEAAFDDFDSHIELAKRLQKQIPNSHILDQYTNPGNPLSHYDGTAEELLYQTDRKIDAVVIGAGTGGGVTGISRKLKENLKNVQIIAVDPIGSILAMPQTLNSEIKSYKMEGIGYDFVPQVLDRSLVDKWYKCEDVSTLNMARRLIEEEGILCGGSSGAVMAATIQYCQEHNLNENHRVVVVLVDGVRNYMTKHLSKDWMIENKFINIDQYENQDNLFNKLSFSDLKPDICKVLQVESTVGDVLKFFKESSQKFICIEKDQNVHAVVFENKFLQALTDKKLKSTDKVQTCWTKDFVVFPDSIKVAHLYKMTERNQAVFVTKKVGAKLETIYALTTKHFVSLINLD